MKKIIAMLLALLFVTALAACGSKTAETAPAATQAPAAEQKHIRRQYAAVVQRGYCAGIHEPGLYVYPRVCLFKVGNAAVQPWGDAAGTAGPAFIYPQIQHAGPACVFFCDKGSSVHRQDLPGLHQCRNEQQ